MSHFRAVNASLNSKSIAGSVTIGPTKEKSMPLGKVLLIHEHRLRSLETKNPGGVADGDNDYKEIIESLQVKLSVLEEKFVTLEKQLSNQNEENIVELEIEEN